MIDSTRAWDKVENLISTSLGNLDRLTSGGGKRRAELVDAFATVLDALEGSDAPSEAIEQAQKFRDELDSLFEDCQTEIGSHLVEAQTMCGDASDERQRDRVEDTKELGEVVARACPGLTVRWNPSVRFRNVNSDSYAFHDGRTGIAIHGHTDAHNALEELLHELWFRAEHAV